MSAVSYSGSRLIPAPFVNINKQYVRSGDEKVGSIYSITLQGNILAFKGSPDKDGDFYTGSLYPPDARSQPTFLESVDDDERLGAILRKQEAIRELFKDDGKLLEIQSFDNSAPIKCNPRVIDIVFAEGKWHTVCPYTINLEADILSINGVLVSEDSFNQYISSAEESWSLDTDETPEGLNLPRTYVLTHNLNSVGKKHYDETGTLVAESWQEARKWVNSRLGLDSSKLVSSGVLDLPSSHLALNHVRSENIDEVGGSYSVTETWLLASGTAREDFTINSDTSAADGLTRVSIQGNIEGFEQRDSSMNLVSSKYNNASSKFNDVSGVVLIRAQNYAGLDLNVIPLTTSIGRNPVAGTINYSYEYDNRATNLLTDSKSEVISVSESFGVDTFAVIPVLGRQNGPVLQNINTPKEKTRALSMEFVMPIPSGTASERFLANPLYNPTSSGEIQSIVDAIKPVANGVFVGDQQTGWDMYTGRFSLNINWVYGD